MTQYTAIQETALDEDHSQSDRRTETQLSTILINALADWEDIHITELDRLSQSIDLEALDDLFAPTHGGTERSAGQVRFQYHDHYVTVTSDGVVRIESQSEKPSKRYKQDEKP
ncbi:HalOD1 output domain-containing protein [Haladaptatus sp. NG-SE-30]